MNPYVKQLAEKTRRLTRYMRNPHVFHRETTPIAGRNASTARFRPFYPTVYNPAPPSLRHLMHQCATIERHRHKNQALTYYLQGMGAFGRDWQNALGQKPTNNRSRENHYQLIHQGSPLCVYSDREIIQEYSKQHKLDLMGFANNAGRYQDAARRYGHYLDNRYEQCKQSIVQQGGSVNRTDIVYPQGYRLRDVVRNGQWLNQPEHWPPAPLPMMNPYTPQWSKNDIFLVPQKREAIRQPEKRPMPPAFNQLFQRFPTPVEKKVVFSDTAKSGPDEIKKSVATKNDRPIVHEESRKERPATSSKPKTTNPYPAQSRVVNGKHMHTCQHNTPLERALNVLQSWQARSRQETARLALKNMFDKLQDDEKHKKFDINKERLIEFLTIYREAIKSEYKEEKKKQQRVSAIETLLTTVNKVDENDQKSLLIIFEAALRTREEENVTQLGTPRCGGFSVLKAAWGKYPEKMAKITSDLVLYGEITIASASGKRRKRRIPLHFDSSKYKENIIDTMMLSVFYEAPDLRKGALTIAEDNKVARLLGFYPKVYRSGNNISANDRARFIRVLQAATLRKAVIKGTVKGEAFILFRNKIRESIKNGHIKQEIDFDKVSDREASAGETGHSIIIEKIEPTDGGKLKVKLHTWGRKHHCIFSRKGFFDIMNDRGFTIYDDNQASYGQEREAGFHCIS